ncbi:MAG: hypothetical protein IPP80_08475 [Ignavibacteria bacterium]|nr:hypothetical protein [Ignavibacteria bacterium]
MFGDDNDADRLASSLHVCALEQDLSQMPAGLSTEIGERGVNLSGQSEACITCTRCIPPSRHCLP